MHIKEFYPVIESAYHSLSMVYAPALQAVCESAGFSRPEEVGLLLAFPTFAPGSVNLPILSVRGAYTAPELYEEMLQSLCEKGLLESADEMEFLLTEQGAKTIKEIMQAIYSALNSIQPLPVIETMDLASRLKDCADACMVAIEPPGTWCIQHTRKLDPGPGAPVMVRIEQFFTELCAFRDDAHLSAWKSYESNGHAWDILTLLWVEKSKTLDEINSKLKRRGNSLEQSRAAVEQLVKKGWVIQEKDVIRITPFGSEIRKIAEETTDRYYASPFKKFNELDLKKVIELTDKFRRSLPHIE